MGSGSRRRDGRVHQGDVSNPANRVRLKRIPLIGVLRWTQYVRRERVVTSILELRIVNERYGAAIRNLVDALRCQSSTGWQVTTVLSYRLELVDHFLCFGSSCSDGVRGLFRQRIRSESSALQRIFFGEDTVAASRKNKKLWIWVVRSLGGTRVDCGGSSPRFDIAKGDHD